MSQLPTDRAEGVFEDFKPAYTKAQATIEANRCLYCHDAPCITACPTGIDIPEFIRKIATGNVRGSARTIFASNVLGMTCARVCPVEVLCVGDCVYNHEDVPPIQIGRLQRYATDMAFDEGWNDFEAGPDSGKSVGILGGGPAGLACAHMLRRLGHAVTIYEKNPQLGGLNTDGVAPYKLRADDSLAEVDWVLQIGGIDIQQGTLGDDLHFADIEARHDAVFIGVGLGPDKRLDIPGHDLEGVEGAVHFIRRMKLEQVDLNHVKSAVVVGGGNTAIDAVRELMGLGVPSVTMAYRGSEEGMSGYAHEWKEAKNEGAHAAWGTLPTAYQGADEVEGVELEILDDDKKPTGDTTTVPAQLVLEAVGQGKLGALFDSLDGIEVDWGRIKTDEHGATGRAGVYAGGDCRNGGKEVVNAVAEGRDAALHMHKTILGGTDA